MNQESVDFAAHRFTPRMARSHEHACAVEHYAPHTERRIWRAVRAVLCLAAAAAIGADQDEPSPSLIWWLPVVLPFAGTVSAAIAAIYWSELRAFFSQVFA